MSISQYLIKFFNSIITLNCTYEKILLKIILLSFIFFFIVFQIINKDPVLFANKEDVVKKRNQVFNMGIVVDSFNVTKGIVKKGQTLGEILYANHIDHPKIAEIESKSKGIFDVRRVNSGQEYTVICTKDSAESACYFIYQEKPY